MSRENDRRVFNVRLRVFYALQCLGALAFVLMPVFGLYLGSWGIVLSTALLGLPFAYDALALSPVRRRLLYG